MHTQCLGLWHIKERVVSGLEKDMESPYGGEREKEMKLVLSEVNGHYTPFFLVQMRGGKRNFLVTPMTGHSMLSLIWSVVAFLWG